MPRFLLTLILLGSLGGVARAEEFSFDASDCKPAWKSFGLALGSVSIEVLGREEGHCRFRYTEETEGGWTAYLCGVAAGTVSVSTDGHDAGASYSFELTRDCAREKGGNLILGDQDPVPTTVDEGKVSEGKKQGVWTLYRVQPDGTRVRLSSRTYVNGKRTGPAVLAYSADGKTALASGSFRDDLKQGHWRDAVIGYADRVEEGEYDHDRRVGKWVQHDLAGKVLEVTSYKQGRRDGTHRVFDEKGRAREEGNYVAGDKDGLWRRWYEGTLIEENHYAHGVPDGYHLHYSGGALIGAERYVNGKREGRSRAWSGDGRLTAEWCYRHGELLSYGLALPPQPKPAHPPRPSDIDAPCL